MENTNLTPVPENFEITESFGELSIAYKWNKLSGIILFIFSLFWNGMLFFMISKMPAQMMPFTFLHLGVGIYLFYYGLCQIVNKTTIICTSDELKIAIKPLPYFGNKKINSSEINQLYFNRREIRNKNSSSYVFDLNILDSQNRSKRIIKGLQSAEQARYIETKLEKFYKIKNLPVDGEYR